jgi:hypothetical protein
VPILLPSTPAEILLAGDFNCVLSHADSTGQRNYSKMIEKLVKGFSLYDAYDTPTPRPNYTLFTPTGASRLDRIYITEHLRKKKHRVEMMPAAFTDHLAVIIRLSLDSQSTRHGPSYWKMNASLLHETDFLHRLRVEWELWKTHEKYHPNRILWWDRYAKGMIRLTFQREGSERRRDHANMEHFYYTVTYQALKASINHAKKTTNMKHLKTKITRLHSYQQQRILLDNNDSDGLMGKF